MTTQWTGRSAPTGPVIPPSPSAPEVEATGERWRAHPGLAAAVRAGAFLLPVLAAVGVSLAMASRLPVAAGVVELLGQWALLLLLGAAVAKGVRVATKRVLPLGALLELSLVFPDEAPSRLATALRRPSDEQLRTIVDRTKQHGLPTDATEAAQTVLTLVTALSEHDRITRGHSERVRVYATMIAQEMGLTTAEISAVQWAGLLHDVGKLGVDADILNKPGRLTEDEYEAVKAHTITGAVMVEPLRDWLGDAVDAAAQHHERWDGRGYPYGLHGTEISLAARIIAVADVYDVITAKRSYKEALPAAWARREIANGAGTQFDPRVVRAFLAVSLDRVKLATGPFAWLAQVPILASLPVGAVAAPAAVVPAAKALTAAAVVAAATSVAPVDLPTPMSQRGVVVIEQPAEETYEVKIPRTATNADERAGTARADGKEEKVVRIDDKAGEKVQRTNDKATGTKPPKTGDEDQQRDAAVVIEEEKAEDGDAQDDTQEASAGALETADASEDGSRDDAQEEALDAARGAVADELGLGDGEGDGDSGGDDEARDVATTSAKGNKAEAKGR